MNKSNILKIAIVLIILAGFGGIYFLKTLEKKPHMDGNLKETFPAVIDYGSYG